MGRCAIVLGGQTWSFSDGLAGHPARNADHESLREFWMVLKNHLQSSYPLKMMALHFAAQFLLGSPLVQVELQTEADDSNSEFFALEGRYFWDGEVASNGSSDEDNPWGRGGVGASINHGCMSIALVCLSGSPNHLTHSVSLVKTSWVWACWNENSSHIGVINRLYRHWHVWSILIAWLMALVKANSFPQALQNCMGIPSNFQGTI